MILDHWPPWFMGLVGGRWPESYVAFDLETTGYDTSKDVITEWGHCVVEDRKVVDRLSLVIDWTGHDVVPDHWLRARLVSVKSHMEQNGAACHMSYDRMKAEGTKPAEAFKFIRDFIDTLRKRDAIFVSHGGYTFDEKMLAANFGGFTKGPQFSFGDNNMIDTEGVEKASQAVHNARLVPKAGDTLRTYFHRVKYTRLNGVKSNLGEHCYEKYGFGTQHGIRRDQMHGADTDAFCCHLLMEAFRGGAPLPAEGGVAERARPVTPQATTPAAQRVRRRGQRNN